MDDLDRLYDRLATNIREGFPHLQDRAFQLGDIGEHLVPYRLNRRELGFDSVRQFELALMRLAAGERGYLRADPPVQDAFRRGLAMPEPDAALLRDHARASVALSTGRPAANTPVEALAAAPAPAAAVPTPATEPAVSAPAQEASRETPSDMFGITPATFDVQSPARGETPAGRTDGSAAPLVHFPPASRVAAEAPRPRPARPDEPLAPRAGPTVMGGPCRYCGQALPDGRAVTFCPQCGQNVTVQQCPACSTELEVGWRHCITCGRAMNESTLATGGS
jgi:hypothetical protein